MKKRLILAAAAAMLLTACSPEIYRVFLEVRQPSPSGLKLSGKSMAVVYMDGPEKTDSLLSAGAATVFAEALEKDYFGGESVIGMYACPVADTMSLDAMHKLVMDTGEDVVFVLRSVIEKPKEGKNNPFQKATHPDSAYVYASKVPVSVKMFVYDSMGKEDKVNSYKGTTLINAAVFNSGIIPQDNLDDQVKQRVPGVAARSMGERMSKHFLSKWTPETFSFYWFDDINSYKWQRAIDYIGEGKFTESIKVWEDFVKGKNRYKAAHACYNMAMAFYLLGDMQLAAKWLDEADKLENVSLTGSLRRRIINSLEK
ncbi:MAG: tetratricopeptide repeat protein [Bacteroidales bacterium]|nr:tetratricopeptide repeat protein [Bacteroidales bacterium]MBP5676050.1 tetratricopeptide repeat protein [Bacteroidales bacterium]